MHEENMNSGIKREPSPTIGIPHKKQATDSTLNQGWNPNKNTILILTKAKDNSLVKFTQELAEWLIFTPRFGKKNPFVVYVDAHLQESRLFGYKQLVKKDTAWETHLRFWTPKLCYKQPEAFHLAITLGGDGTILFFSTLFQRYVPPIMPFHLGSLGFLAPFLFTSYRQDLTNLFEGKLKNTTNRMRLSCTVYRYKQDPYCMMKVKRRDSQTDTVWTHSVPTMKEDEKWEIKETAWMHKIFEEAAQRNPEQIDLMDEKVMCYSTTPMQTFHVLNEIIVDRGPSSNMSMLELFGDERHLTTVQADGLCIATATGSTAYSLSASGSLTHPDMQCTLVTPICPHTLSFRPMLLPKAITIRIVMPFGSRHTAHCRFDGRNGIELKQGDHVKITASPYPVYTYTSSDSSNDWFSSVQSCLQWNSRQRQKSFVVVEGDKVEKQESFASIQNGVIKSEEQDKLEYQVMAGYELCPWTDEELSREPFMTSPEKSKM